MSKQSGVYAIQHLETGRTYIGSSVSMSRRWREHQSLLKLGEHHARDLQVDWNLYGPSAFVFVVLEVIQDEASRIVSEQLHIDRIDHPYNANGRAGSGPKAGWKHSESSRRKMSAALTGRKKSDAHKAALSASKKGHVYTPEHRAAIGVAGKGKKRSAETRAKMSESRRKVVVTWGASISEAKRGVPNPKLSAAVKGRPWSNARREAFELTRLKAGN